MNKFKILLITILALIVASIITLFVLLIYYERKLEVIVPVAVTTVLIDTGFAIYIMNSKRHAYTKACWLFSIVFLLLAGCLLFVIFGSMPMDRQDWKTRRTNQAQFNKFENYEYSEIFFAKSANRIQTLSYTYRNEHKPIYQNNKIELIDSNTMLLAETIRLIRVAKEFIHCNTYIIRDSVFFRIFTAELIKKAKSGVKVRFLYDWLGEFRRTKKNQIMELKRNGIEVAAFNPPGFNVFKGATNYRLHSKALIVDNKYAIYGGSNISDEYLAIDPKNHYWSDRNFIIEGEIVNSINISFIDYWINFTDYTTSPNQKQALMNDLHKYLKIHKIATQTEMQFCTSTPNYLEKGIESVIASMIIRAKKTIKLVTPYFIPSELCASALNIAANSGINIQIITSSKPDNKKYILDVNRSQYLKFMNEHCQIYEYNGFIHSKYLIIDDEYVLITTANFDYRSFWNNFESGILVHGKEFSQKMIQNFNDELCNSSLITIKQVKEFLTFMVRLKLIIISLYKPLL